MAAAIAITPTSGNITAKSTVCRVNVTGADANSVALYDVGLYPQEPEIKYYLLFDAPAGTDDGKSYIFAPNPDGTHEFNNYIFPAAGSWTIRLRDSRDDSDAATASVTVA